MIKSAGYEDLRRAVSKVQTLTDRLMSYPDGDPNSNDLWDRIQRQASLRNEEKHTLEIVSRAPSACYWMWS